MKQPRLRRPIVEFDTSPQLSLLALPIAAETPRKAPSETRVEFVEPSPEAIWIGNRRLDEHMRAIGERDCFLVRELLAEQDYEALEAAYAPGGRPPYAPRAMLGILLYGLMHGVSSLRELERLARVDVGCWWVSGGIMPDHSILGRFIQRHGEVLSGEYFTELTRSVLRRTGSGTSRVAGDGTVIEAAASRYRLLKEEAAREAAAQAAEAAQAAPEDRRRAEQAAQAQEVVHTLEQREAKGKDPRTVQVSPSEPEAVVQPLKNRRGYAPSYKPSVLANEQRVIVAHALEASSETAVVGALLNQAQRFGEVQEVLLDAGYHATEVIEACAERGLELLCPEGRSSGEDWNKRSEKQFPKSRFHYDPSTDTYRCPQGERLEGIGRYRGNAEHLGYIEYGTPACAHCPQRAQCTRSAQGRRLKRYAEDAAKEALRQALQDPHKRKRYRQRQAMVEPVFSVLRARQGLNRFRRRGLTAVRIEFALHALAYNLGRAVALSRGGLLALYGRLLRCFGRLRRLPTGAAAHEAFLPSLAYATGLRPALG